MSRQNFILLILFLLLATSFLFFFLYQKNKNTADNTDTTTTVNKSEDLRKELSDYKPDPSSVDKRNAKRIKNDLSSFKELKPNLDPEYNKKHQKEVNQSLVDVNYSP